MIFSIFVGGIKYPKHFGQSGQPIPLPVILTSEPARITKSTKKSESLLKKIKFLFIYN